MLSYSFTLGNKKKIIFSSDEENIEFLDSFAKILSLKKEDSFDGLYKKIFFISFDSSGREVNILTENYKYFLFKNFSIYLHQNSNYIFCKLKKNLDNDSKILLMERVFSILSYDIILDGGFFLHSGLVKFNNKIILLSGGGNFGKSTACSLISSFGEVLCDDMVIILPYLDKYIAHPLPTWSNYLINPIYKKRVINNFYSGIENYYIVSCAFILSKSKENKIIPLDIKEAISLLYRFAFDVSSLSFMNKSLKNDLKKKLFFNICRFSESIPISLLKFNNTINFYKELEKV
ncbi:MAG: hypothetical protein ACP5H7_03320 [Minisyncoccia bacterium]